MYHYLLLGTCLALAIGSVNAHQKRSAKVDVAKFLGKHFAKYALNQGFNAVENYYSGGSELDQVLDEFAKMKSEISEARDDVDEIGADILHLITSQAHDSFAFDIESLYLLMNENLETLITKTPSSYDLLRREEVLSQIMGNNRGIENALRLLHLTLIGKTTYPTKSILEMYWDEVIHGRNMNDFKADSKLQDKTMRFLTYLLELQQTGMQVLLTAITSKYSDPDAASYHHNLTMGITEERMEEQERLLGTTLYKPCGAKSLSNFPGRGQALVCSEGSEFGSICKQRCAGSCRDQKGYWADPLYYPPHGHQDIQCLMFGKWSFNSNGETKVGCSFCDNFEFPSLIKELQYPQFCFADGRNKDCTANTPVNFALKKKVPCLCNGKRRMVYRENPYMPPEYLVVYYRYWCNVGRSWDYCVPPAITRDEVNKHRGVTVNGNKCKEPCKLDRNGYYKCRAENGNKEYCS